jgi:ABC-type amino acid transport substrate-binding protein
LIAERTAAITAYQTVSRLRPTIEGLSDLQGRRVVTVAGPISQEEDYGIALASGSPLRELVSAALLRLKGSGCYDKIFETWFGATQ